MLRKKNKKNRVTRSRLVVLLVAAIAVLSAGCGGGEEATATVASLDDVEVAATPTPETVDDQPEDTTEAGDPGPAETSADPTDATSSDSSSGETDAGEAGSEDAIAEDATDEDMALAFVVCVREAGFDQMPDPTVNGDGSVQLVPPGQQQLLGDPDFQDAAEGCVALIEEATFFANAPDISDFEDDLLAFAQCLRDNGLDVDDPDLSKFVPGQGARMFGDDFNPQDPANADAIAACQSLLPNAGGN